MEFDDQIPNLLRCKVVGAATMLGSVVSNVNENYGSDFESTQVASDWINSAEISDQDCALVAHQDATQL